MSTEAQPAAMTAFVEDAEAQARFLAHKRYLAWRRGVKAEVGFFPPAGEVTRVRMFLWLEAGLFLCIPIAAAAMARGYGI